MNMYFTADEFDAEMERQRLADPVGFEARQKLFAERCAKARARLLRPAPYIHKPGCPSPMMCLCYPTGGQP